MKCTKGNWRVVRYCCRSGNCAVCRGVTPFGTPLRVTQGENYSEAYATYVAVKWGSYYAAVELMPVDRILSTVAMETLDHRTLLQMVLDDCDVLNPDGSARPLSEDLLAKIRAALG